MPWAGDSLHAVCDRHRHTPSSYRRNDDASHLGMDEADRSKPDGLSDWVPQNQAILDHRSRCTLLAERFVRSIKSECLGQMVFVGQASLDRAIADFVAHYHDERSHQGIGNEIVSGAMAQRLGQVEVSERLGGLLNYYHRRAA